MMEKEFKFIYVLLFFLITVILIQSYFLYDFKKSLNEASSNSLATQTKPFSRGFPGTLITSSSDPFEHMKKMQQEIHKSFGHFNSFFADDPFFQEAFKDMGISPLSDIKENHDEYKIELEIPGAKEQKIDIKISGNILTINASLEKKKDVNNTNYIHMERFTQRFERSFILKDDADLDSLKSNYTDGVLEITIPKKK